MSDVKRIVPLLLLLCLAAAPVSAAIAPGFAIRKVADVKGFLTSIAFDPVGTMYVSSTEGSIYRIDSGKAVKVAVVPTASEGNADLLGIVFDRDGSLVAHYVTPDLTADVIARVDLKSGAQTELAHPVCDGGRPCSTEHHGGNPAIAPDGTIYVGLGDFGGALAAQNPDSPAGKIYRVTPGGKVEQLPAASATRTTWPGTMRVISSSWETTGRPATMRSTMSTRATTTDGRPAWGRSSPRPAPSARCMSSSPRPPRSLRPV